MNRGICYTNLKKKCKKIDKTFYLLLISHCMESIECCCLIKRWRNCRLILSPSVAGHGFTLSPSLNVLSPRNHCIILIILPPCNKQRKCGLNQRWSLIQVIFVWIVNIHHIRNEDYLHVFTPIIFIISSHYQ